MTHRLPLFFIGWLFLSISSVLISSAYLLRYFFPDMVWMVYSGILPQKIEAMLGWAVQTLTMSHIPLLVAVVSLLCFLLTLIWGWGRKHFWEGIRLICVYFLPFFALFSPLLGESLNSIPDRTFSPIPPLHFALGGLVFFVSCGIFLPGKKRPGWEMFLLWLPGVLLFFYASVHLRNALINISPTAGFFLRGIGLLWAYHTLMYFWTILGETFLAEPTWRRWFALIFLYIFGLGGVVTFWFLAPPTVPLTPPKLTEGERIHLTILTPQKSVEMEKIVPIDTIGQIDSYLSQYTRFYIPEPLDEQWEVWLSDMKNLSEVRRYFWSKILHSHIRASGLREKILESLMYDPFLFTLDIWEFRGHIRRSEGFSEESHRKLRVILACHGFWKEAIEEEKWAEQRRKHLLTLLGVTFAGSKEDFLPSCPYEEQKKGIVRGILALPPRALNPKKTLPGNFFVGLSLYYPSQLPEKRFSFQVTTFPVKEDGTFIIAGVPLGSYVPVVWFKKDALREGIRISFPPYPLVHIVKEKITIEIPPIRPEIAP